MKQKVLAVDDNKSNLSNAWQNTGFLKRFRLIV